MKYFNNLETIEYKLNGQQKEIKNLFNKLYLQNLRTEENPEFFQDYIVKQNETPEDVSYKMYGTTDYWWIICMINGVEDVFYDWLMNIEDVRNYSQEMKKDYPNDKRYDLEVLLEENDTKRFIRVLKPYYLNALISEFITNRTINKSQL